MRKTEAAKVMGMERADYLIAGAGHAALAAMHAIRLVDAGGSLTVVGRDRQLPYSPTVLPYVVSGRSDPKRVFLRDEAYFACARTAYRRGHAIVRIELASRIAELDDGSRIEFGKLLLSSGARPVIPPVTGLQAVPYHVLRTLDDALRLRAELPRTRHAIVLGAGLIGMHAAENLSKGGARVTIIEVQGQILPGYFDADAAAIIARAFEHDGRVTIQTGTRAVSAEAGAQGGVVLHLQDGPPVSGDLLLIGAGVAPAIDFLAGSQIRCDRGILVDASMRTSVEGVWAAGDVAQAASFYEARPVLNGILPDAVEQGRIAGMDMAGDAALQGYRGAVPLNTYSYFGRHAVSVGSGCAPPGAEIVVRGDADAERYLKVIFDQGRLHGIFAINTPLDAGVMWQLVRRRTDLTSLRARFLAQPREVGRALMSRLWR
jgi:phenylglyoxylate dehydrogenase epsilon subunit